MMENAYVIIGTYTKNISKGIYVFAFDSKEGQMNFISECDVQNPSYITMGRNGKNLYSVTENEKGNSYANAFLFNHKKGEINRINRRVTKGKGACHIAVDNRENFVVTANYGDGSISVFPIEGNGELGKLSQNISFSEETDPKDSKVSHPHCCVFSPDGKYLFVTDLGLDNIYRFDINYDAKPKFLAEETCVNFSVKSGSGPRHLIFDKKGRYLYLVTEYTGAVFVYSYNEGNLALLQEILIDLEYQKGGGAITLSPDGNFLFASMRQGNDGVAIFEVEDKGTLIRRNYSPVLEHPRDIAVSPDNRFLLVTAMNDNQVDISKIIPDGSLEETNHFVHIDMPAFVSFIY